MRKRWKAATLLSCMGLAACDQSVLEPNQSTQTQFAEANWKLVREREREQYVCYLSYLNAPGAATRYQYVRKVLRLPASMVKSQDVSIYYYRFQRPGEAPRAAANCRIPATQEARQFVHEALYFHRKEDKQGSDGPSRGPNDPYYLSPITVVATAGWSWGQLGGGWNDPFCHYWWCFDASQPGGGEGWDPGPPAPCDPTNPPNPLIPCEVPLTQADANSIEAAYNNHLRQPDEFTNPAAREACGFYADILLTAITTNVTGTPSVFRGYYDSPPGEFHYGAFHPATGRMHIDPRWLNEANYHQGAAQYRNLLNTLLHETMHLAAAEHPNGPTMVGGIDLYMDAPFSHLNPGTNSCIK